MEHESYEAFGSAFFRRAVTAERVVATVARVAGERITVGPIRVGPGGVANAEAHGTVGAITASQTSEDPIGFRVQIPVSLAMEVIVAGQKSSFSGDLILTLQIAAHAVVEPLQVVIDIAPLRSQDIVVKTRAAGLQAKLLQRIGNMDEEIRDQVLRVVGELLEAPAAMAVRVIDVGTIIDDVWT